MSYAIRLLESLAEQTWDRIKDGFEFDISQGEETITDFNLLEILRSGIQTLRVVKLSKDEEAIKGIDWEWWIGSRSRGWLRYAVQAKKIDSSSQRYNSLGHKVNDIPQIDLLEIYARKVSAIPLYCFYNYSQKANLQQHWQCSFQYEEKQLGCTVSPSSTIRQALNSRGCRNFKFVHSQHNTIPWRCLLKCPRVLQIYSNGSNNLAFENIKVYTTLPEYLARAVDDNQQVLVSEFYPTIRRNEFGDLDINGEIFEDKPEIRIIPKRILVIDTRSNEND